MGNLPDMSDMSLDQDVQRACHCRIHEPLGDEAEWDAGDRKLMADVAEHGWHYVIVPPSASGRIHGWVFTVGLWHSLASPELAVFGLDGTEAAALLTYAVDQIRAGGPPEPGEVRDGLLVTPWKAMFRPVDPSWYRAFFGYALWFAQRPPLPFLQLVWSDRAGRFPSDPDAGEWARVGQPRLWVPTDEQAMSPWSAILAPEPWPFAEPRESLIWTTKTIALEGGRVLFVTHEPDGDWRFLEGNPVGAAPDLVRAHFDQVVGAFPEIVELADLPLGWEAERPAIAAPWVRRPGSGPGGVSGADVS